MDSKIIGEICQRIRRGCITGRVKFRCSTGDWIEVISDYIFILPSESAKFHKGLFPEVASSDAATMVAIEDLSKHGQVQIRLSRLKGGVV